MKSITDWRDQILREIGRHNGRTTVAFDPDELLLDERILAVIHQRQIELINYDDDLSFRFIFESRFRSRWDLGEKIQTRALIRTSGKDPESLPYDIVSSSVQVSFDLASIFPSISYQVVATLPKTDLDGLYSALQSYSPENLSINEGMDFVLMHVYQVAPELVKQPEDLLKFLLRRHYTNQAIPEALEDRLVGKLTKNPSLANWPLETLLKSRKAFFEFLQERWPIFVNTFGDVDGKSGQQHRDATSLKHDGPPHIPFDSHDVRVFMDNMFVEGLLKPVDCDNPEKPLPKWMAMGVRNSEVSHALQKLEMLLNSVAINIPDSDSAASQWQSFAYKWAELSLSVHTENIQIPDTWTERISTAQDTMDRNFLGWLRNRYSGLNAMAPNPPVMVSHIPRYLSRRMDGNPGCKVLFILVDGMAVEQWLAIKRDMEISNAGWKFDENSVFAWAPSLTSFSRQSAFAGKAPVFFPASISSTDREKAHWSAFWNGSGLKPDEIRFEKYTQDPKRADIESLLNEPDVRAIGVILTQVDSIMHGACLGSAGMMNQVRLWASQSAMANIVEMALAKGFEVYISSDHGNVESVGIGRPSEGVEAELRGQRVRIFDNPDSRARVRRRFPDAIEWPPDGLPENCFVLFAPGNSAFVTPGERVVTHGGLSLQEMIVPFVRVGLD